MILSGCCIGVINGLFGAGGGVVAVWLLKKVGLDQHKSHATAMSIILPLSVVSTAIYFFFGKIGQNAVYVAIGALPGGFVGAKIMARLSEVWLTRVFSAFMAAAAIRLLLG